MPDESRRQALRSLVGGWAGLTAASVWPLAGCAPAISGQLGSKGVRVASLDQLPPGAAQRVVVRGEPVLILNQEGTIRAFSGFCTHEACELGWNPTQRLIRCPCHGSAFDGNGQVQKGPAVDPLPEFVAIVERNNVYVGAIK